LAHVIVNSVCSACLGAVLAAAFLQPATKPALPNEASAPVVVPLELLQGRPVISVKVNGAGPFRVLIDPTSTANQLDVRLLEELKVRAPDRRGGAAPTPTSDSRLVSLEMGTLALPGIEVQPVDMASVVPEFSAAARPRGLLGSSAWGERLLTIDYPSWRIALAPGALPEADGEDVVSLLLQPAEKALAVMVAGVRVGCELDLQSTAGLVLPESLASTLPLLKPPVEAGVVRTRHGVLNVREGQLAGNVTFGTAAFVRPEIQFSAQLKTPLVGGAWLQDFVVIFDLKNRRARLAHRRH
jgi:hypothetical protein